MKFSWEQSAANDDQYTWWLKRNDGLYVGFVDKPIAEGGGVWRAAVAGGTVKTFDDVEEAKAWALAMVAMEVP